MSDSILVAYATRYGSTQEVAERIAAILRERHYSVETRAMRDVQTPGTYAALVLGAPLYNAAWYPDAHRFLALHKATLTARPVAVYALGPLSTSPAAMQNSRQQLERELGKYAWFKPATYEVFIGKYDPSKLSFVQRLLNVTTASDNRDWDAIRAWALELSALLQFEK